MMYDDKDIDEQELFAKPKIYKRTQHGYCTNIRAYIHTYIHTHMHTYIQYTRAHTHAYSTHTHTHIHTRTHSTHTHTFISGVCDVNVRV